MDFSKALYYPHLEFGSAAWVKSALLYWDGLARFRGDVEPDDEPEIQELVAAGLIEKIDFEPLGPRVKRLFGERVADLLRDGEKLPDAVPRVRGRAADQQATVIDELAREMESQGREGAAEAVRTMPEQAFALVATLAAHVSACDRALAPVTDDPLFSAIDTYFAEEGITSDPKAAPEGLAEADLLIPTPSVDAMASLPVARLLEIRNTLRRQRRAFRQKVEALKDTIAELPTAEAVREHVTAFAADIRDDLEAERQVMRKAKVKDDWSFLSITVPASLAVGVTLGGPSSPILGPIAGVGAVALSVTNWFVQRQKGQPSSSNYMLSLQTALGRRGQGLESGLDQLLSR
jgi:hypothetical protein